MTICCFYVAHISPTLSRSLAIDTYIQFWGMQWDIDWYTGPSHLQFQSHVPGRKEPGRIYRVKNFTGVGWMWAHKYIHSCFVQVCTCYDVYSCECIVTDSTRLDGTTSCWLSWLCAYLDNIVIHGYHWCVWPLHLVWLFSHSFPQQPSLDISLQNSSEPRSSWSHFLLNSCKSH